MIYKRVLTEVAFCQEARGSELFKRNSIPGRGNRLCNGPEAGRGKGGRRKEAQVEQIQEWGQW